VGYPDLKRDSEYDCKKELNSLLISLINDASKTTTIIVDEIQKSPLLARELILGCYNNENFNGSLRILLTGTSPYGSSQPLLLEQNLLSKLDYRVLIKPPSVLELTRLMKIIDVKGSFPDNVIRIWTCTGGIIRILRRVLKKELTSNSMISEIQYMKASLFMFVTDQEKMILKSISKTGRKERKMFSVEERMILDDLERKGMVETTFNSLIDLEKGDRKDWYTMSSVMLRIAFGGDIDRGNNETEFAYLQRLSGHGFEDCFFSLLKSHKLPLVIEGICNIHEYFPVNIANGNRTYDVDGLLIKLSEQEDYRDSVQILDVVVVCLKMQAHQLKRSKMNIMNFLERSVGKVLTGLLHLKSVTILVAAPTISALDRTEISNDWASACSSFSSPAPLPKYTSAVVAFEDILGSYSKEVDEIKYEMQNSWPVLKRPVENEIMNFKNGVMMVSGWRGVGKTHTSRKIFPGAQYVEL
jgi:hypothetical protein